jgi:hypothetical protein
MKCQVALENLGKNSDFKRAVAAEKYAWVYGVSKRIVTVWNIMHGSMRLRLLDDCFRISSVGQSFQIFQ